MRKNEWFKSSASDGEGSCVEVMLTNDDLIKVRDTKDKGTGPVLTFTAREWRCFQDGIAKGEFDLA